MDSVLAHLRDQSKKIDDQSKKISELQAEIFGRDALYVAAEYATRLDKAFARGLRNRFGYNPREVLTIKLLSFRPRDKREEHYFYNFCEEHNIVRVDEPEGELYFTQVVDVCEQRNRSAHAEALKRRLTRRELYDLLRENGLDAIAATVPLGDPDALAFA